MPTLIELAERTQALVPSKWRCDVHHFAESLDVSVEEANGFFKSIEEGGTGSKSDGSWQDNPAPLNVKVNLRKQYEDNVFNLHCADMGSKSAPRLDLSEPSVAAVEQGGRYIRLGRVSSWNKNITVKVQREIVKYVIGTHQGLIQHYPDVRAFYHANMPLEFLDNKLNHLMDEENLQRDERRDVFNKNRDASLSYTPAKHCDRKETQQMISVQAHQTMKEKYAPEVIAALEDSVQEQIKISNIAKQGTTSMEKEHAANVKKAWEERLRKKEAKKNFKRLDVNELQEKADSSVPLHDKNWGNREDVKYDKIVEKVGKQAHFNKIPAGDAIVDEVLAVLPCIGKSRDELMKLKKTTEICGKNGILKKHFALIDRIAKGKAENSLNSTDISGMAEEEIRRIFIRADKSASLGKIKKEIEEKYAKLEAIYNCSASVIAPKYVKLMNLPPKDDGSWADEDDEDDEGEEVEPEQMDGTDVEDATSP